MKVFLKTKRLNTKAHFSSLKSKSNLNYLKGLEISLKGRLRGVARARKITKKFGCTTSDNIQSNQVKTK